MASVGEKKKTLREFDKIAFEMNLYDILTKVFGSRGLAYEIISSSLPTINQEINSILFNCVKFNIILRQDDDSKHIEVLIKYKDFSERPIEICGGMERMIASLAIRAALINVSNLPKPNVLFVDEGVGVLDSTHLDSVSSILKRIKQNFKTIFIITHIQEMQDVVDHSILVDLDQKKFARMTM